MAKSIYVGNLSFQTVEEGLTELFKPFGEVTAVRIIRDRETNRSRGMGFVDMANDEEAATAIQELNGKELDGRALTVNEARPKEDRPRGDRPRFERRSW